MTDVYYFEKISQIFFGKIKKNSKTQFNISLKSGKAFTTLKFWNKTDHSSRNYGLFNLLFPFTDVL